MGPLAAALLLPLAVAEAPVGELLTGALLAGADDEALAGAVVELLLELLHAAARSTVLPTRAAMSARRRYLPGAFLTAIGRTTRAP
jgi:hypothetical protein